MSPDAIVLVRLFVGLLLGYVLFLTSAVSYIKSRIKEKFSASPDDILRNFADQPWIAGAYAPGSILALSWAFDYRSYLALTMRHKMMRPSSWRTCAASAGLAVCIAPGATILDPGLLALAMFLAAMAPVIISVISSAWDLRSVFPTMAPRQYTVLILDTQHVHYIIGQMRFSYPWTQVGRMDERGGIVAYERRGIVKLIPPAAFHSLQDTRVFVATVNALRDGLPPPPYDWSAYVPIGTNDAEIWPPPIG